VAGRSLDCASCWGGWSERTCPRSATASRSVAVDRTLNLQIDKRTLHWAITSPNPCVVWYSPIHRRLFAVNWFSQKSRYRLITTQVRQDLKLSELKGHRTGSMRACPHPRTTAFRLLSFLTFHRVVKWQLIQVKI